MIGRLLCRLGLHRLGPCAVYLDTGAALRACQRAGCDHVQAVGRWSPAWFPTRRDPPPFV